MKTIAMIMAGGKGSRLTPLTCHRAKPSVPFGGRYRIIDFVLSNFINSGYRNIYVLTQYMSSSLISHISRNWHLTGIGENIEIVPAQMRMGEHWYRGTADSIYQNLNLIRDSQAKNVAVFGGDHIYKFAINEMEEFHDLHQCDLTVAAFPVPIQEAHQFGVIQIDEHNNIIGFQEKPKNPTPMPNNPNMCLVSMGNYFFRTEVLEDALISDAQNESSKHDFGHNIIPSLVSQGCIVKVYDFAQNTIPGDPIHAKPYWRDVGTVDSFYQANMELRSPLPSLNMYNRYWRIRTSQRDYPPARFVKHGSFPNVDIVDSLICEGSIVSVDILEKSLIGYDCFLHAGAEVRGCILFSGCDIGSKSRISKVIMDKNCSIEAGCIIGEDLEKDRERFPFVTPSGIVVLPKGTFVPKSGPILFTQDIGFLLKNDPATKEIMKEYKGRYIISDRSRHSHESAGPRYKLFGPGSLIHGAETE